MLLALGSVPRIALRAEVALALTITLAGCARPASAVVPTAAAATPPDEHWETMLDVQLVSPERCGTGPYEVLLPEREVEWGRRVVFEVYGPRGMEIMDRLDSPMMQWGIAIPRGYGDHSRCRAPDVAATAGTGATAPAGSSDDASIRAGYEERFSEIMDAPPSTLPRLVPFEGELIAARVQVGANAWLPHGNPWYYADELRTARTLSDRGGQAFRLRFWFPLPSDLDGVVIRVRDQLLVPDLPIDEYRERFAARVRDADALRTERRDSTRADWERRDREWQAYCAANPELERCAPAHEGRMPPPPRTEERPPAPGPEVDWVPGYWSWVDSMHDFLWVGGTYVVRARPAPTPTPTPEPTPEPASAPASASAPRTLDATIPPPPALRSETIPPPPSSPGALWVRGSWSLRGSTWEWAPGRWVIPPARGARPRAPEIVEREGVRIYFPGGWVDVR